MVFVPNGQSNCDNTPLVSNIYVETLTEMTKRVTGEFDNLTVPMF